MSSHYSRWCSEAVLFQPACASINNSHENCCRISYLTHASKSPIIPQRRIDRVQCAKPSLDDPPHMMFSAVSILTYFLGALCVKTFPARRKSHWRPHVGHLCGS